MNLLKRTKESLYRAVAVAVTGKRIGDVSAAVQEFVEGYGYSVVRELVGHGIGRQLHEKPDIPNYGKKGWGAKLQTGLTICIEPMIKAFRERHAFVVQRFNEIPGLKCLTAGGAFYAFPDAREAIAKLHAAGKIAEATDLALSDYLLQSVGVAVVPGSAFGAEGYFRISFATSMENLREALDRIETALS